MKRQMKKIMILTIIWAVLITSLIINRAYADDPGLTLSITTDKAAYVVDENVKVKVEVNEGLKAASYYLDYDSSKLEFKGAEIENSPANIAVKDYPNDNLVRVVLVDYNGESCAMIFTFTVIEELDDVSPFKIENATMTTSSNGKSYSQDEIIGSSSTVTIEKDVTTNDPIDNPVDNPTEDPTEDPTENPTENPTEDPTEDPTDDPTDDPTEDPTDDPTEDPSEDPTDDPTEEPSGNNQTNNNTNNSINNNTSSGTNTNTNTNTNTTSNTNKQNSTSTTSTTNKNTSSTTTTTKTTTDVTASKTSIPKTGKDTVFTYLLGFSILTTIYLGYNVVKMKRYFNF